MAVDYDLVVVGSSLAGIYAARNAIKLQARVALVTQCDRHYLPNDVLFNYSLGVVGHFKNILDNSCFISTQNREESLSLTSSTHWIDDTSLAVKNLSSLSTLSALGVDVIAAKGEFCSSPNLELKVKKRSLRSRRFLLATGSNYIPDFADSNTAKNYLTFRDLGDYKLHNLPKNIIVVGSEPIALELAQTLSVLGKQITLVVKEKRILPQEDRDISILIQAQLEADGVNILTNSTVSQVKIINNQKWLQAGDHALSADEIIIADYRQPNIAGLNLAGVNVKYNRQKVYVNAKLETTNPNIYACGDLIGGYILPNIAQYEAKLIIKNTLFFSCYKANYYTLPWAILTQPSLARVGLNERQARHKYGKIYVIKQHFSNVVKATVLDRNLGVCKLIVDPKGEILGCSIFDDRAAELITIPALMMQHKIKLDSNPMRGLTSISIPNIYPSMTEILEQAINNFYQQKIQNNPKLLNRLRAWFSLRKN